MPHDRRYWLRMPTARVGCTENHHVFGLTGSSKQETEEEPTDEIIINTRPLEGKGKGTGFVTLYKRKYNSFIRCQCGKTRKSCGPHWKTENVDFNSDIIK